ncbi:D-Ala-D-Ala carboxypeptidase family metallohydrolase [Altericroceibacterium endophyticum]|uniref:DUF882 domain-containing protein n=1 Tax=Altericroceibacterium endophyticum TaxID=1808508 RepID=A0A6I4T3W5_9SPHN|nr:D-Ala-D-Ala carboxypeptidase family metallohydrolase [Altericroceibacterium endophyticum]MXO64841.1 DUF882 domain-containing protein [Altericroceibacterium endophyticum]
MQLSRSFTLSEFTTSQTATRQSLDNTPPDWVIRNLRALCENVLQPLRDYYARPVVISSGYRSPAVNRAVGGSSSSQHTKGQAADFEIPGISNVEVARWMQKRLNYDQLILEFHTPGEPNSGWIHVSWRPDYRNQELTAQRVRKWGRWSTQYVRGLVA